MDTKLQYLIEAARGLSPLEQLSLIDAVSQSLRRNLQLVQPPEAFWTPERLQDLIAAQQTKPTTDIASLKAGFWPEDESADDFIKYIYQRRREDRLRDN